MIESLEGVEDDPGGRAMRQVPTSGSDAFGNALWISEDGSMRRRHYNPWSRQWSWGDMLNFCLNDADQLCGYLDGRKETVERLIAYAWLKRRKPGVAPVLKRDDSEPTLAHNLYWADCANDDGDDGDDDHAEEVWKRLSWSNNGVVCDDTYHISSNLRIKTPQNVILRGNHFKHHGLFCAIKHSGLVQLEAAFRNVSVQRLPPCIKLAAEALLTGHTPHEFAAATHISTVTSWTYYARAASAVDPRDALEWGKHFLDIPLYEVVLRLHHDDDPVLGERLLVLAERLSISSSKLAELRFVVSCVKRLKLCPKDHGGDGE